MLPVPTLRRHLLAVLLGLALACPVAAQPDTLAVPFDGLRGQVEVGGPYVGAEFHGSRALPSRISFYAPVANSIDLSTDYWQRGDSRPFTARLRVDGREEALDDLPMAYHWTPYRVSFARETPAYHAEITYRFGETLPILSARLRLTNRAAVPTRFELATVLQVPLRTSHTYATRRPAQTATRDNGQTFTAHYDAPDTGLAQVFVLSVGHPPVRRAAAPDTAAAFDYDATLAPGESLDVVLLVGSAARADADVLDRARRLWADDVAAYEHGIRADAARRPIDVPDAALVQTARLARTLLRANRHHLDGEIVPMPEPAQYNFFFTHDLLLTDLGAVRFDTDRVRADLRYVASLARADSTLPHARYWKDSTYVTEPANPDNWNHLWVNILAASYLKHSADTTTVAALYPVLAKSLQLMLRNQRGGLMYANRPDWWDIGDVYGARAYLTALTVRALESFASTAQRLGRDPDLASDYLGRAGTLRAALVETLWDDDAGYLLNELENGIVDRHYYSGSLLAAAFGALDEERTATLLDTATRELLDPAVGIRNAMPADFHTLIDTYRFNGMEAGAPFLYMNGGIWTQGSAWYALALLEAGRPDAAREALARYFSIAGIVESPNGHPAFYEYRNGDPASPRHGEIDKPTFLWAGGWYLNVLYALAGARGDAWNLWLSPDLPAGFGTVRYDLMVEGRAARVVSHGEGPAFAAITVDGQPAHSAVLTGPAERIELARGVARAPYLASATARVTAVRYEADAQTLVVDVAGAVGQQFTLDTMAPTGVRVVDADGGATATDAPREDVRPGGTAARLSFVLRAPRATVRVRYR